MGSGLAKAVAYDFGIQWIAWLFSAALQTDKFYDLTGSCTFIFLTLMSLREGHGNVRQVINSGMVLTWAFRLGFFLFTRVMEAGGDRRLAVVKHQPGIFWVYWTIQGVWVLSTLLPTLIVNYEREGKKSSYYDYIGWVLWVVGFITEVVADRQKSHFRSDPANKHKFITSGLWSISRHPNYLGEILMWTGLYISSLPSLKGWKHISVLSPIFITYLLTNISGIPLLEAYGKKKWGSDPTYQAYIKNTAKLIPFVW